MSISHHKLNTKATHSHFVKITFCKASYKVTTKITKHKTKEYPILIIYLIFLDTNFMINLNIVKEKIEF